MFVDDKNIKFKEQIKTYRSTFMEAFDADKAENDNTSILIC